jgi:hypothetical protein
MKNGETGAVGTNVEVTSKFSLSCRKAQTSCATLRER